MVEQEMEGLTTFEAQLKEEASQSESGHCCSLKHSDILMEDRGRTWDCVLCQRELWNFFISCDKCSNGKADYWLCLQCAILGKHKEKHVDRTQHIIPSSHQPNKRTAKNVSSKKCKCHMEYSLCCRVQKLEDIKEMLAELEEVAGADLSPKMQADATRERMKGAVNVAREQRVN